VACPSTEQSGSVGTWAARRRFAGLVERGASKVADVAREPVPTAADLSATANCCIAAHSADTVCRNRVLAGCPALDEVPSRGKRLDAAQYEAHRVAISPDSTQTIACAVLLGRATPLDVSPAAPLDPARCESASFGARDVAATEHSRMHTALTSARSESRVDTSTAISSADSSLLACSRLHADERST